MSAVAKDPKSKPATKDDPEWRGLRVRPALHAALKHIGGRMEIDYGNVLMDKGVIAALVSLLRQHGGSDLIDALEAAAAAERAQWK